jgi:hypothetical protein
MTLDYIWAQLEQDLAWRHAEIRLLSNTQSSMRKESERDQIRRSQLVMLYAHAEGFCKLAFSVYLKAVNSRSVPCGAVSDELVASGFEAVFHAMRHGDEKGKVFSSNLPDDPKLHVAARRRDFFSEYEAMMRRPLELPEETVNTESNLSSKVLRRNLFRLGFPEKSMNEYETALDELVNRRNSIAHGDDDSVVKATDYGRLQKAVFGAMDFLALMIVDALDQARYLNTRPLRVNELHFCVGEMG